MCSGRRFTGVSMARFVRPWSTVENVLLAEVRVCREASVFIPSTPIAKLAIR